MPGLRSAVRGPAVNDMMTERKGLRHVRSICWSSVSENFPTSGPRIRSIRYATVNPPGFPQPSEILGRSGGSCKLMSHREF